MKPTRVAWALRSTPSTRRGVTGLTSLANVRSCPPRWPQGALPWLFRRRACRAPSAPVSSTLTRLHWPAFSGGSTLPWMLATT